MTDRPNAAEAARPALATGAGVPVLGLDARTFTAWFGRQPRRVRAWLEATGFAAKPGEICLLPATGGKLGRVLAGLTPGPADPWAYAALAAGLPPGRYRLEARLARHDANLAALGWLMGTYRFGRYRARARPPAELVAPSRAERAHVERQAEAVFMVRDLVNTPAEDMGPAELAAAAEALAGVHGARCRVIAGDQLLAENYPAIHAVGRASVRAPRLIDLVWGDGRAPRVTLVGKGVCFDTGGLDLKTAAGMALMKKDMGGAAHVLGLAALVMGARLNVRLRVLIPAVENSVAGNAYRPGDVIATRKGLSVEIGNTDAEGRVILCDALAEADRERPDLLIDLATLTGAARVALGPDLPALFTDDEGLAQASARHGAREADPLWRLPLWAPYEDMLKSTIADIKNAGDGPFAGAITAALYLRRFVERARAWMHVDLYAWNAQARPGRPAGGEAQALRALFALLAERYGRRAGRGRSRA